MINFENIDNKLILVYKPYNGNQWLIEKLENDMYYYLRHVFYMTKDDCYNLDQDKNDNCVRFIIGEREGDYFRLKSTIFDINHNFYFSTDFNFQIGTFLAFDKISIINKIDEIITEDIYVGGEIGEKKGLTNGAYEILVKNFPNKAETFKYQHQRISVLLKEFLPLKKDFEGEYDKYIQRKNKRLKTYNKSSNNLKNINLEIEIQQFSNALKELKWMLDNMDAYDEHIWQEKIQGIIQLLYPKYILYDKEHTFKGIDGNYKRPDFLLVDASGFVDILELKKPTTPILTKQASYRNNYVPVKDLSGSIQQIQKYIYCLTKLDDKTDEFFVNLRAKLPEKVIPTVLNPQGILLIGRSSQFNEQQIQDFEIIKRQYKNVADILTYDDLVLRLENVVNGLKLQFIQ